MIVRTVHLQRKAKNLIRLKKMLLLKAKLFERLANASIHINALKRGETIVLNSRKNHELRFANLLCKNNEFYNIKIIPSTNPDNIFIKVKYGK